MRRLTFLLIIASVSVGLQQASVNAQICVANIPHLNGQWLRLSYDMPLNPVSATLLRTGQVLVVAGSEADKSNAKGSYRAALWEPADPAGNLTVQEVEYDIWCSGTAVLPDGRPLIVGGTMAYGTDNDTGFSGDNRASMYDPAKGRFAQSQSMVDGRWYATATTLGDGRIMAFSGLHTIGGGTNRTVEIYDLENAGAGWTSPGTPIRARSSIRA